MDAAVEAGFALRANKAEVSLCGGDFVLKWLRSADTSTEMLLVECRRISEPVLAEYREVHLRYVNKREARGRKFCLCYDTSELEVPGDLGQLRDFIDVHRACRDAYENFLVCTVILSNNPVVVAITNTMLSTLYKPTRPVRLFDNATSITPFIASSKGNTAEQAMYVSTCEHVST